MSKTAWSWCNLFRCQWGVTIFTSDNFFKTDISKKAHEHIWIHSLQLCTHTNAASPTRPVLKETASWQDVESKERKLLKETARKQMPFFPPPLFSSELSQNPSGTCVNSRGCWVMHSFFFMLWLALLNWSQTNSGHVPTRITPSNVFLSWLQARWKRSSADIH